MSCFISASIYDLQKKKSFKIKKANKLGIFNRYWNTNVLHQQKIPKYYKKFTFLHIPADKIFLSNCFDNLKNNKEFKDEYFDYITQIKKIININITLILPNKLKEKIDRYYLK